jgi:hypothetical protein
VQTLFPYSKPSKLKCGNGLSNRSNGARPLLNASPARTSVPNFDLNRFARFERFAGINS